MFLSDALKSRPWLPKPTRQASGLQPLATPPLHPAKEKIELPYEWAGNLPITKQVISEILKETNVEAVTSNELQHLKKIQDEFDAVNQIYLENSVSGVAARYYGQNAEIHQKLSTGNAVDREAGNRFTVRSRDDLHQDARLKRNACRAQLEVITRKALPIFKKIISRLEQAAEKFAVDLETPEKKLAERLGVEWQPSLILATAWQATWRLSKEFETYSFDMSPRRTLETLHLSQTF